MNDVDGEPVFKGLVRDRTRIVGQMEDRCTELGPIGCGLLVFGLAMDFGVVMSPSFSHFSPRISRLFGQGVGARPVEDTALLHLEQCHRPLGPFSAGGLRSC